MSISASAPGKVLICGGYLVVESPNIGLSLGVSARFTTKVLSTETTTASDNASIRITVNSPQFKTRFVFVAAIDGDTVTVTQEEGPKSPFLYYGILFSVASGLGNASTTVRTTSAVTVDLLASNDFYSQRAYLEQQGKPVTVETLRTVPPHNPLVGEVSKTGLGSSAAMTTSFVACLHEVFGIAGTVERIHRVAQVAHSVAQGKIGSGFDVYTATYGTSIYRRFPAARAEMMMAGASAPTSTSVDLLSRCVDLSQNWLETTPFDGLPRGVKLILADIHEGGSGTPGMVAKVTQWRNAQKGIENNLWDRLGAANVRYVNHLQAMVAAAGTNASWDSAVAALAKTPAASWKAEDNDVAAMFAECHGLALNCRRLLKEMGTLSGVEIEPDGLTKLLDDTASLPGVLAAGCPGAGGYDAVFALVLTDEAVADVERYWETYTEKHVCPLLVREDPRGISFE